MRRRDERVPEVGRIGSGEDLPADSGAAGGRDGLREQSTGAGVGGYVPAPQPGPSDHRRCDRGRHDRQLRVQAPDPGVSERGGLLAVAVHFTDRGGTALHEVLGGASTSTNTS